MKFLTSLFVLLGMGQLLAGLRFESLSKEITVAPSEPIAVLNYSFVNESDQVVKIEKIATNCSCISGETDKLDYQPGEKGTIRLKFKTGTLTGKVRKEATITTSDRQVQKLAAQVTVPEYFSVSPRTLKWRTGDAANSQVIQIKVSGKEAIKITKVVPSTEEFEVEVKTIKEGWEYQIIATPKNTASPGMVLLRIETDSKIRRFAINQAFLVINQAPPQTR